MLTTIWILMLIVYGLLTVWFLLKLLLLIHYAGKPKKSEQKLDEKCELKPNPPYVNYGPTKQDDHRYGADDMTAVNSAISSMVN